MDFDLLTETSIKPVNTGHRHLSQMAKRPGLLMPHHLDQVRQAEFQFLNHLYLLTKTYEVVSIDAEIGSSGNLSTLAGGHLEGLRIESPDSPGELTRTGSPGETALLAVMREVSPDFVELSATNDERGALFAGIQDLTIALARFANLCGVDITVEVAK